MRSGGTISGLALGGQLFRKHQQLSGVEQVLRTHALPNTCMQHAASLSSRTEHKQAGLEAWLTPLLGTQAQIASAMLSRCSAAFWPSAFTQSHFKEGNSHHGGMLQLRWKQSDCSPGHLTDPWWKCNHGLL